jgi:hypothetical protein
MVTFGVFYQHSLVEILYLQVSQYVLLVSHAASYDMKVWENSREMPESNLDIVNCKSTGADFMSEHYR